MDWKGQRVYLLKPMLYMNRSGVPVSTLANFYKITASDILVAHDELDFAPGVVRFKLGGGHGGHNGLRDICTKLGSSEFARVRLGIGHPGNRDAVVEYVLGHPTTDERELLRGALEKAVECLPQIIDGQPDKAMNALH